MSVSQFGQIPITDQLLLSNTITTIHEESMNENYIAFSPIVCCYSSQQINVTAAFLLSHSFVAYVSYSIQQLIKALCSSLSGMVWIDLAH